MITKSRYCRRCDAQVRYQCKCNPRSAMAWQRENVFHMGKRYKGKRALEYCYELDQDEKTENKQNENI